MFADDTTLDITGDSKEQMYQKLDVVIQQFKESQVNIVQHYLYKFNHESTMNTAKG